MNSEQRIESIEKLQKTKEPISTMPIWYKNARRIEPVYQIDLDNLVYNPYNGRISSYVKSHEIQNGIKLDPSNSEDSKLIEQFIKESSPSRHEKTKTSLAEQGQLKYGIVTKDGFIIDGNRRASILKEIFRERSETPGYFFAVILDEKLEDNPKEIRSLETRFQLGEDDKVDYNAIEKYLKCKDLEKDFSIDEIAKMMNEKSSVIKENLQIMSLMDEYLKVLGYNDIYTRLFTTEDLFIRLNKVIETWKTKKSNIVQWNYDESDLSDLKQIYFDLIRYVYNRPKGKGLQAKDIREIVAKNSKDSFFAQEEIWNDFSERHSEKIDPISEKERTIDEYRKEEPNIGFDQLLKSRDEYWAKQVDRAVKENIGLSKESLDNLNNKNEPLKLLNSAKAKLDSIDIDSDTFLLDDAVFAVVDEIRKLSDSYKKTIIDYKKRNK